jgi:hypothetical protein
MIVNQILCSSLCRDQLNGLEDEFSVEIAWVDSRSSLDPVQIHYEERERGCMYECPFFNN